MCCQMQGWKLLWTTVFHKNSLSWNLPTLQKYQANVGVAGSALILMEQSSLSQPAWVSGILLC
jgi:hypothetical protein